MRIELRGWITKIKKSFIIHLREKRFKHKINNHELPPKVCLGFSLKRKENDLDTKCRLLGYPAENASSPTISQI